MAVHHVDGCASCITDRDLTRQLFHVARHISTARKGREIELSTNHTNVLWEVHGYTAVYCHTGTTLVRIERGELIDRGAKSRQSVYTQK